MPLLLSGIVLFTVACDSPAPPAPDVSEIRGETMGTYYSVKTDPDSPISQPEIDAVLEQVNDQMSTYREKSELSTFNRSTSLGWLPVSQATAYVCRRAREIGEQSGGAFEVTAGPLVNLWSFGPTAVPQRVPSDEEIESARQAMGPDKFAVRDEPPALRKADASVYVDLSGIAKGFGVDEIGRLLRSKGIEDFLVDIGGEMLASGRKQDGSAWSIAIEKPSPQGRTVQRLVELSEGAVATSGDYRNFFEEDGVRYSHTIDPRTGRPITHRLASVTVLDADCTSADAWATALMVLGEDEGYTLAEERGLAALFLIRSGSTFEERETSAFASRRAGES